ncbi:hypothetical protein B0T19DRAFT_452789 [Cercophora scortea]|uniref:Cyanovirin-N domain-containing protein n=1 Tax=Cercophora scortea TaxID=314031 RepID=A0AAE0J323_9PEZI|nr:hypothetical protein B0T19DRAFT_452789 [Cercophora scortea]
MLKPNFASIISALTVSIVLLVHAAAGVFLDSCQICFDNSGWRIQQLRGDHRSVFAARCNDVKGGIWHQELDLNNCLTNNMIGELFPKEKGDFTIGDVHTQGCALCHVDVSYDKNATLLCVCGIRHDGSQAQGKFVRYNLDDVLSADDGILGCFQGKYVGKLTDGCPED